MNICIPNIVLEPVIQNLSTNFLFSGVKKEYDDVGKEMIQHSMRKAELEASVVVGETFITVEDFIFMQVGDVIKLNKKVDAELELKIGGKTKYLGSPGTYKKSMAFKINKVIEKDDDKNDE